MLEDTANSSPEKIGLLKTHMIIGIGILVLMVLRFLTRLVTTQPAQLDAPATIKKLSALTHMGLYLLVFLMAGSGIVLALQTGLFDIVFNASGVALPESFKEFTPRLIHGAIAKLLALGIAVHIAAALYHQFILKDGIFSRIWFGKRS